MSVKLCVQYVVFVHVAQLFFCTLSMKEATVIMGSSARFNKFSEFILASQQKIIKQLQIEDGKEVFLQDVWHKGESSHGITAVLQRGDLLEKAACSTTIVKGILSEDRAKSISSRGNRDMKDAVGKPYFAAAISLVLHSRSPMVPTFRSDIRYFEVGDGTGWFGGGADLTPYYLFNEDAEEFHKLFKDVCDGKYKGTYDKCKRWCDDYFYLPARQEHRGVGGIFFDDLSSLSSFSYPHVANKGETKEGPAAGKSAKSIDEELDDAMAFTQAICDNFMPSYIPIVKQRRDLPYTEEQRHWQLLRRGRYIEFNMLYDRGVRFGLVPGGRIEAVMVSCPPLVAWDYNHTPRVGSSEEALMGILRNPVDWCIA